MSRPERIGRYQLVARLAAGGMGEVYLARTEGLGGFERHVVLKTLVLGGADEAQSTAMLLDEARLLGYLHHQHIAPIFEVNREDGRLYLVMDYVHGHTAHEVWQRTLEVGAVLPIDFSLTVASAAASALHYAHTRRDADRKRLDIVHRDVSLSNLMIGFDGAVKLIDFGIAKAANQSTTTQVGFVKGTIGYMTPEQIRGDAVDARTDVFALGIVLYELTTMRRAFREESDRATIERIKTGAFVLPSTIIPEYPRELQRIVTRALSVDPRERYPDADSMRREIEALGHRLELLLGDAAITEVMTQLFEDRREPWQRRPTSRAETELEVALELVVALESVTEDEPKPADSPRRFLRGATEVVDALMIERDTPAPSTAAVDVLILDELGPPTLAPRVTFKSSKDGRDTDGVPVLNPIPVPIARADSEVITKIAASPVKSAKLAATPRRARPIERPTKQGSLAAKLAPHKGWIAAGATLVVAIVASLYDTSPATPAARSPKPLVAVAVDAGVVPVRTAADANAPAAIDGAVEATATVKLRIVSTPPDAKVSLDGHRIGKTPYDGTTEVQPGLHTIKVRLSGYVTQRFEVELDADVDKEVTLVPKPAKPANPGGSELTIPD